jgi:hypothetical protein
LAGKTLAGDRQARRSLILIENALRSAELPGMRCLLCDYEFSIKRRPMVLVLLTALHDEPRQGIVNGICPNCAQIDDLQTRIIGKYRQSMITDLHLIPEPHRAEGHG